MNSSVFKYFRSKINLYIMLIPAIIGFLVFQYIPIIYSVIIGFKNYNVVEGLINSPWVGFKYFIQFFNDPFFFRLIRNTVMLGIWHIVFYFPCPLILALMINEVKNEKFKRITQSITYLPYFMSLVVIIGIIYNFFGSNGMINDLINSLGKEPVNFLNDSKYFRPLYILSEIWQKTGWMSIIYLASIVSIDPQLYEASIIDGANRLQRMWYITISEIRPIISVLIILSVGNLTNLGFERVYLLYNPSVYETADVLQTYIYRRGIGGMEYGYAGAVGLFNSVISVVMLSVANYLSKKTSEQSIW